MSFSKPKLPSHLFSERFDLKLFLSLELIRELVDLQHRQSMGDAEYMGDFAPDHHELLKDATNGVLPSGLEYMLRSCDTKGKKGMVLYKDEGGNYVLFVAKSALYNHNETLLSLFGGSITASCTELLFNLVSQCYDHEHNKDYAAVRGSAEAVCCQAPLDTTQVKQDLKHFPAEVWNPDNKDVMMYYGTDSSSAATTTRQCLHFARQLFDPTTMSLGKEEALVVECMPNVWWGCAAVASAKVEAAYAEEATAVAMDGSAPNIVQICRRMLAARTVLARWRAPSWRSSRTFPTTTTSTWHSRSRWGCTRCSTCWTPRPAR